MTVLELMRQLEDANPQSEIIVYSEETHERMGVLGFFGDAKSNDGEGPDEDEYPALIVGHSGV